MWVRLVGRKCGSSILRVVVRQEPFFSPVAPPPPQGGGGEGVLSSTVLNV
jgi:hypothetical protein